MVEECLLKMTLVSKMEIDAAMELHKRDKRSRHGQKLLARTVTELVHGAEMAMSAEKVSDVLFGGLPLSDLSKADRELLKLETILLNLDDTRGTGGIFRDRFKITQLNF